MADHLEGLSSDDEETSTDITNFNLEKGQPCVWERDFLSFWLLLGVAFLGGDGVTVRGLFHCEHRRPRRLVVALVLRWTERWPSECG